MSDRSAVVSGHTAIFPLIKKSTCRAQVFFSTKVKKKKSGIPDKTGGRPSLCGPKEIKHRVTVFVIFL